MQDNPMVQTMKTHPLHFVIAGCLAIALPGCRPQTPTGVFTVTDEKGSTDKKGPEVVGSVNIKVDISTLQKQGVVELPLPNRRRIKLVRKRLDSFEKGRFAWFGDIEGDKGSFALISITQRAITGKITTSRGEIYRINYAGRGIHRVDEINGKALVERPNDEREIAPKGDRDVERDCPDPATQVDVMVVYTADAETGAGGPEGMEAFVYECMYFTNLAYQNSNVNLTMHLVHHEKVTYTETGDEDTDLDKLETPGDGEMDNVHALRDAHGADLVSLITETMEGCGLANRQFPVTAGFESSAFSVVKRSCAAGNLSFAHETAHNMGARHDCANAANSAGPNHGHFVSAPADGSGSSWRTVMAYNSCTAGPCTRIPFYSNPGLNFSPTGSASTDPMGTAAVAGTCTNDNTDVLNDAAPIVANFRCSSPGVSNVWMRDTWNDTGLQPDPATAAEAMWRSPYIWIRNSEQDPTFIHQHEHENPKIGISNWIYVKMHNGGAADNGVLQIYFAEAAVSLTWPTAWTLLATVPVNLDAASTRIVEIPWNDLPGEGHYCMVARWNSTADAVSGETADINNNTRQSNNIVWRNLNIEAMDADADEKRETFFVQSNEARPISLAVSDDALFPKHPFVGTGRVFLRLEEPLYAGWKKGGSKGRGIKAGDNEIEITLPDASIDNIVVETKEKLKATIRFVRTKETIRDKYHFTIRQMGASGKVDGGITYEIYTYKR
jgi:hypothetical protein